MRDEAANIEFFQIVADLQDKIWVNEKIYENIYRITKEILEITNKEKQI